MTNSNQPKVYGIDLGTTYSCIAHLDAYGIPEVLLNSAGHATTPSVVYISPDGKSCEVGEIAKNGQVVDYEQTVSFIKREMGKEYTKPTKFPNGMTPVEISARILKKLVQDADAATGGPPCRDVVITCPAYFGTAAREQTKLAGKIAGLNVLRIINEPTAAAIAYGIQAQTPRTILVYDLGGGTFDISLIRVDGKSIKVIGSDGDRMLGGGDWDMVLAERMLRDFNHANRTKWSFAKDPAMKNKFMLCAEEAKKMLTGKTKTKTFVDYQGKSACLEISREDFESWTKPLLEKTVELTRECLEKARRDKNVSIDKDTEVLLVGGSSRMPQVGARLAEFFKPYGCRVRLRDPDECVAKGAALIASSEFAEEYEPSAEPLIHLLDVTSKSYGIKCLLDDRNFGIQQLLFRNSELPLRAEEPFVTIENDQTSALIHIYESESEEKTIPLTRGVPLDVDHELPLPPGLPKGSEVTVLFELGKEGILQVSATAQGSKIEFPVKLSGTMSAGEIGKAQAELCNSKIE